MHRSAAAGAQRIFVRHTGVLRRTPRMAHHGRRAAASERPMRLRDNGRRTARNRGAMGCDYCVSAVYEGVKRRSASPLQGGRLNIPRYYEGLCGKALWMAIWASDCERVCIENPTPSKIFSYPEPAQKIQPWQFGSPWTKLTLLWERGLAPLVPTNIVEPVGTLCPSGSYSHKHGEQHRGMFTTDRAKNRSKTPPGLAKAMAEQWLGDIAKGENT